MSWRSRVAGAATGLISVAAAIAAGEGLASVLGIASPVEAVAGAAIDLAPPALKDFAVATFGEADKAVLLGGVFTVLGLTAVGIGQVGLRHPRTAAAMAGVVGAIGVLATLAGRGAVDPVVLRALPGLLAVAVAVVSVLVLSQRLHPASDGAVAAFDRGQQGDDVPADFDRRRFIASALVVGAVGVAGGGTALLTGPSGTSAPGTIRIPRPASSAKPIAPGTRLGVSGITRFVTPVKDFYRVDTALDPPRVDVRDWSMRVHGRVDRELTLDFDALVSRRLVERDITMTCVSNEVGGDYVGNARWIGVPIAEILREAGIGRDADAVKSTAVDGFTIGTPLSALTDGRDALFAIAMNGEPLTAVHGFPVRMIVPGLYGYVSATKWLTDVEVTRFADFKAYWSTRGWSERAPIKTSSRIDVPKAFAKVRAGRVPVAGVAWSQRRGIRAVEVRVDGGEWRRARLAEEHSVDTWRQWVWEWEATPGEHRLEVRVVDGNGTTQTSQRADVRPNGSSGWHSQMVTVE